MENGRFYVVIRGEDGRRLASGAEDFMDKMSDDGLAGRASDAN